MKKVYLAGVVINVILLFVSVFILNNYSYTLLNLISGMLCHIGSNLEDKNGN